MSLKGMGMGMLKMVQAAAADYDSGTDSDADDTSDRECSRHGFSGARNNIDGLRNWVFLLLCDSLWAYSKYTLLRDISDKSAWPLHRHMCVSVLDWGHYCHLHTPSHAYFNRFSWHLWHLRSFLCLLLDICLLEGS